MAPKKSQSLHTNKDAVEFIKGNRSVRAAAAACNVPPTPFVNALNGGPNAPTTIASIARESGLPMRKIVHSDDHQKLEDITTAVNISDAVIEAAARHDPFIHVSETTCHAYPIIENEFRALKHGFFRPVPESTTFLNSLPEAIQTIQFSAGLEKQLQLTSISKEVRQSVDMGNDLVALSEVLPSVSLMKATDGPDTAPRTGLAGLGQSLIERQAATEYINKFCVDYRLTLHEKVLTALCCVEADFRTSPYDAEPVELWCEVFCPFYYFTSESVLEVEITYVNCAAPDQSSMWQSWIETARSKKDGKHLQMSLDRIRYLVGRYADMDLATNDFLLDDNTWKV